MRQENKVTMQEMLQELSEEKKGFQDKINKNLNRISEIDAYLNSIYEKEDSDFKVFSPRSVENVYKEQLEKGKQEKYVLENENQHLYRQVNKIERYLENLRSVLEEERLEAEELRDYSTKLPLASSSETLSEKAGEDISYLSLKGLDIQEKDRHRIARDLHDTSLQSLAHLIHQIELSSLYIDKDPIQAKLELASVNKNLRTIIEDIRNTVFDLRPMSFDDLGLKETLENFINKLQEQYKITITAQIDEIISDNQIMLITLYRVVREGCLNAAEHSDCRTLFIRIKKDDLAKSIHIEIRDDGIGFDVREVLASVTNHYGLKIMKERVELLGGSLEIHSSESMGTQIIIEVPVCR